MNTPLSSFTALVKFKFDRAGLTDEIKKVRQQLQGLHDSHVRQKDKQAKSDKTRESSLARQLVAETKLVSLHARANRENAEFDRKRLDVSNKLHNRTANPSAHLEAFRKHQAAQAKIADKVSRDRTASALKWQRLQDRQRSAEARAEQKRLDDWYRRQEKAAQKLERDAAARRIRELRSQGAAARLQAARESATRREDNRRWRQMRDEADFMNREFNLRRANANRLHSEALRINAQVDRQRLQQRLHEHSEALRMNREFDRQRLRQNRPPANAQGGGGGGGGSPNPWHIGTMAGGLGGLITRGNLAAVGAGAFTQQSFSQANFDVGQAPQFEFITGSAEKGAEQIAFVNKEVDRLSLNLFEANTMYRQLLASTHKKLGIEKTQELFSSFQNIATMLNLNTDAQARGMRAFAQMASKGQVMS